MRIPKLGKGTFFLSWPLTIWLIAKIGEVSGSVSLGWSLFTAASIALFCMFALKPIRNKEDGAAHTYIVLLFIVAGFQFLWQHSPWKHLLG